MVSVDLPLGWHLIDTLAASGFPITVAFWAKVSAEEKWLLYVASPVVDEQGPGAAYQRIEGALRGGPEWDLGVSTLTVVGADDPMAKAAAELVKANVATGPNRKPFYGVKRVGYAWFDKWHVDGAFIYPPWEPGLKPVW
jgi:hypothetical protein